MHILAAAKAGFDYNRTQILLKGLEALGHKVEKYLIPDRNAKFGRELAFKSKAADLVYVPPFRHRDLSFVRNYSSAPLVFDPLISRYLTKVVDYGHYWKAPQKWWVDFKDFRNCDLLLADTQAHLNYFKKTLLLPSSLATAVVPVGVDTRTFIGQKKESKLPFTVGFYGTFVPLQGVSTLIETAALLKNENHIRFEFLGTGHQYQEMRNLAQKRGLDLALFKGWIAYEELAKHLSNFDLALGIFGSSLKADLVVPNKLYHYAALGIPCITKETIGVNEVFTQNENILTLEAEPALLAEKILELAADQKKLADIGLAAKSLIVRDYSHLAIAEKFVTAVEESGLI